MTSEPRQARGLAESVNGTQGQPEARTDSATGRYPAESGLVPADSDTDPVISVVIPTLNEEEGVGECIERVKMALAELELPGEVVLSDSSTDRTPEIAREMGAIVVEPDEPGYGYAYRYAFERARGEYIVIGDADTTYDFVEIPKLLEPVRDGEADICMGSRLDGEIRPGAMPALHQYIGNPLLTKFLNAFYDAGVSDAHSGFRVFRRGVLEDLDLDTNGMEFASEMIMEAGARDLTIEERPIVYHEREGDATLDSFQDGWRHVRFMLLNAPGYLFSVPGTLMTGLGILLMTLSLTDVNIGMFSPGTHTMIGGSLLTLSGAQIGAFGVFATVSSDPIRRPSDPLTTWVVNRVRLEHGATAGALVFAVGVCYVLLMGARWVGSGFTQLPLVMTDIAGMTAVVLGIQVVFSSFFMSAVAD
jgi:hypothetical protein